MIGKYLKELREKHHLTQEEAAKKLGVTRPALSKWENDKSYPDIEKLKQISKLYEVTIENIVYAGGKPKLESDMKNGTIFERRLGAIDEKSLNTKSVFDTSGIVWVMIGLALMGCFISPLGIFLSISFFFLGKRIKQKYLGALLKLICIITATVNVILIIDMYNRVTHYLL